jgi:ribosomal protein S18 acetylase RimI-like enzyme
VTARFVIEPLSKAHDRSGFACGNDRIDAYFREAVSQDVRRKYATCFVARQLATGRVAGFYTLSSSNVPLTEVPDALAKKLPRYPTVPAVLIGWLARHRDFDGCGLGEALLFDAIKTVATAPIGVHAIFADAIDEKAASFYVAFGFTPLIERPQTLYLPVATALALLE